MRSQTCLRQPPNGIRMWLLSMGGCLIQVKLRKKVAFVNLRVGWLIEVIANSNFTVVALYFYKVVCCGFAVCGKWLRNITVFYGILRYFTVYYGILRYITVYYGIRRLTGECRINTFPHIDAFWHLCSRRLFENMAKKEEIAQNEQFRLLSPCI